VLPEPRAYERVLRDWHKYGISAGSGSGNGAAARSI
jgi:hypothetical protein